MKRENKIATTITGLAKIEMFICGIVGLYFGGVDTKYGFHLTLALPWWVMGFISGLMLMGFAEIIHLLQNIYDNQKK